MSYTLVLEKCGLVYSSPIELGTWAAGPQGSGLVQWDKAPGSETPALPTGSVTLGKLCYCFNSLKFFTFLLQLLGVMKNNGVKE